MFYLVVMYSNAQLRKYFNAMQLLVEEVVPVLIEGESSMILRLVSALRKNSTLILVRWSG